MRLTVFCITGKGEHTGVHARDCADAVVLVQMHPVLGEIRKVKIVPRAAFSDKPSESFGGVEAVPEPGGISGRDRPSPFAWPGARWRDPLRSEHRLDWRAAVHGPRASRQLTGYNPLVRLPGPPRHRRNGLCPESSCTTAR